MIIYNLIKVLFKLKINFTLPKKYQLLVFDDVSVGDLKNILKDRTYYVLVSRPERLKTINLNWNIIKRLFKFKTKNLYTAYLAGLVEAVDPKIVITADDLALKFSDVAKLLSNKIKFMIVQNSANNKDEFTHLFKTGKLKKNLNEKLFFPNFYCFGENEESEFKRNNIQVKNFFKFGCLRLSNYLQYKKLSNLKIQKRKFDVALISEFQSPARNQRWDEKGIDEAFGKLANYTIEFSKKHNLKFIFILKAIKMRNTELNFYRNFLTKDNMDYLLTNSRKIDREKFSSYTDIEESNVVVGKWSTLLREKLALKGKILSCNFTDRSIFNFPITSICSIENPSFKEFENRMIKILKMSDREYLSHFENNLITLDENNLTHELINRELNKSINV